MGDIPRGEDNHIGLHDALLDTLSLGTAVVGEVSHAVGSDVRGERGDVDGSRGRGLGCVEEEATDARCEGPFRWTVGCGDVVANPLPGLVPEDYK